MNFFLGKPKMIEVKGTKVKVWRLRGTNDFFVDSQGRFISWRWKPKAEPKATPFQRAQEKWGSGEGKYVVYERGLASAWRSRRLALFEAWKEKLPKIERIWTLIDEEARGAISLAPPVRPTPELKEKLREAGFAFSRTRKPELKEARVKILFLYRDINKRLNVGALLARATAISDRLRERLQGIYSWAGAYSGQLQFLELMQRQVDNLFEETNRQVKILSKHAVFSKKSISEQQRKALTDKFVGIEMTVSELKPLRPYNRWVQMMLLDFEETIRALKKKDYHLGQALLERIKLSLEIKRQQRQLDKFLLVLQQDAILKQWRVDQYRSWLEKMLTIFSELKEREAEVVFREPICTLVVDFLVQAKEVLVNKKFIDLVRAIKQAYVLL